LTRPRASNRIFLGHLDPFEKGSRRGAVKIGPSGVRNPGTYLGFIEKISHLKDLGINAVEFLPLQEFYIDDFLLKKGLTNYWGYNTIGFFAPELSYSTRTSPGCQVNEFKTLVRELHKEGIEIIVDISLILRGLEKTSANQTGVILNCEPYAIDWTEAKKNPNLAIIISFLFSMGTLTCSSSDFLNFLTEGNGIG
jgi:hypothetical protein